MINILVRFHSLCLSLHFIHIMSFPMYKHHVWTTKTEPPSHHHHQKYPTNTLILSPFHPLVRTRIISLLSIANPTHPFPISMTIVCKCICFALLCIYLHILKYKLNAHTTRCWCLFNTFRSSWPHHHHMIITFSIGVGLTPGCSANYSYVGESNCAIVVRFSRYIMLLIDKM